MTESPKSAERRMMASECLSIAEDAAALVMTGYRTHPRVDEKEVHDLVTEYDRRSQDLILARLERAFPGAAVIAEESSSGDVIVPKGLVFTVDPLDGTTNFVHGHPSWCVAIGALFDGVPIVGAVLAPCLGLAWLGATSDDGSGLATRNGEPCRVSATSKLGSSMIATGFPPDRSEAPSNNFDSFIRVKKVARAVRRCGSAAIDLAFVSDGTYDGYWERRLLLWDCAAAGAILLAAGGRITAIGGGVPHYEKGHIVATNGLIHDVLVEAVGEA